MTELKHFTLEPGSSLHTLSKNSSHRPFNVLEYIETLQFYPLLPRARYLVEDRSFATLCKKIALQTMNDDVTKKMTQLMKSQFIFASNHLIGA